MNEHFGAQEYQSEGGCVHGNLHALIKYAGDNWVTLNGIPVGMDG